MIQIAAEVDRPLRRAMLTIMRLSPPCFSIEVRSGLARLLEPSTLQIGDGHKPRRLRFCLRRHKGDDKLNS